MKRLKQGVYATSLRILEKYNVGKLSPTPVNLLLEKMIFWCKMGYIPDFKNPDAWGDYICNRKFYGDYRLLAGIADKYKVRNYVEDRVGSEYLNELYDVVDSVQDISESRYQSYPTVFVVKPNHASERVYINKKRDYLSFKKHTGDFLHEFGNRNNEFHYKLINKKILVEEYLNPQQEPLREFKSWVFNGKVEFVVPSLSVYESKLRNDYRFRLYTRNWQEPDIQVRTNPAPVVKRPKQLDEIIEISEALAKGWEFIRVDLFLADGKIKFGELTPTPSAGRSFFLTPDDHTYLYDNFLRK